jgi:hypothetical protein
MMPRFRVRPALIAAAILSAMARPASGRTEQLVATWQASIATTAADGRLQRTSESGDALIAACGDEQLPPIPRSRLGLVYDTSVDALEVVRIRDGSVVCAPFRFIGAVLVGSLTGGGVRHAVVVDGDGHAIGSVVGSFTAVALADGSPGRTVWKGKVSGGQHDDDAGTDRIVEGVFRTGAIFRPRPEIAAMDED